VRIVESGDLSSPRNVWNLIKYQRAVSVLADMSYMIGNNVPDLLGEESEHLYEIRTFVV